MNKEQWKAFIDDTSARQVNEQAWLDQEKLLHEAEKLKFDENWQIDYAWPGVIYSQSSQEIRVIDIRVWSYMRALMRGYGEAGIRRDKKE